MPAPYCWGLVSGGLPCCLGQRWGLVMWWVETTETTAPSARRSITHVAKRSQVTGRPS